MRTLHNIGDMKEEIEFLIRGLAILQTAPCSHPGYL